MQWGDIHKTWSRVLQLYMYATLQWRHNGRDSVSNHQPHDCLCLSHIQPRAPYDFYHPYDFLPVRPSEAPVGILRLDTAVYSWFGWIIRMTPPVPRAVPVRASYGPVRESSMFFISYWTRTGPVRDPQGCRTAPLKTHKGIDTTRIGKNPARASYFAVRRPCGPRTVPTRTVHGLFKISRTGPVSL